MHTPRTTGALHLQQPWSNYPSRALAVCHASCQSWRSVLWCWPHTRISPVTLSFFMPQSIFYPLPLLQSPCPSPSTPCVPKSSRSLPSSMADCLKTSMHTCRLTKAEVGQSTLCLSRFAPRKCSVYQACLIKLADSIIARSCLTTSICLGKIPAGMSCWTFTTSYARAFLLCNSLHSIGSRDITALMGN